MKSTRINIDTFRSSLISFLNNIFTELKNVDLNVSELNMDHVCWRCESVNEYDEMLELLKKHGILFHQSIHNDREISLIQLDQAISYLDRKIDLIELPSPKPSKPYCSGFEHVEFVIDDPLESWIKATPLPWDTKNIAKKINPDVKLSFREISVKFHPYSLAYVVKHLE